MQCCLCLLDLPHAHVSGAKGTFPWHDAGSFCPAPPDADGTCSAIVGELREGRVSEVSGVDHPATARTFTGYKRQPLPALIPSEFLEEAMPRSRWAVQVCDPPRAHITGAELGMPNVRRPSALGERDLDAPRTSGAKFLASVAEDGGNHWVVRLVGKAPGNLGTRDTRPIPGTDGVRVVSIATRLFGRHPIEVHVPKSLAPDPIVATKWVREHSEAVAQVGRAQIEDQTATRSPILKAMPYLGTARFGQVLAAAQAEEAREREDYQAGEARRGIFSRPSAPLASRLRPDGSAR